MYKRQIVGYAITVWDSRFREEATIKTMHNQILSSFSLMCTAASRELLYDLTGKFSENLVEDMEKILKKKEKECSLNETLAVLLDVMDHFIDPNIIIKVDIASEAIVQTSINDLYLMFGELILCAATVSYTHLTLPTICSV